MFTTGGPRIIYDMVGSLLIQNCFIFGTPLRLKNCEYLSYLIILFIIGK